MTRDSKWRARRMHRVEAVRAYWRLMRLAPWVVRILRNPNRVATQSRAWTLFGQRPAGVGTAGDGGVEPVTPPRLDAPTYLCMACSHPIRGAAFVETRSGLRRHVTCPDASTWGDERLDRLWDDIKRMGDTA